jgi:hypothetical protein
MLTITQKKIMDHFFHNYLLKSDKYHPFASDTLSFELEFVPPVHHAMYTRLFKVQYSALYECGLYY